MDRQEDSMLTKRLFGLAIAALAALAGGASAQVYGGFPVAVLECEIPNLDTFVVHGSVPLQAGFTFDPVNCPFSLFDKFDARLPTQWEAVAYRADGSLLVVEMLGAATRGSMAVGSRQRFEVRPVPSADPDLPVGGASSFVNQLRLRANDAFGNAYEGAFTSVALTRMGAAQATGEFVTRLLPVNPSAPNVLPQLGAAQAWISIRAGGSIFEIALNYHNGSSQHVSWNIYFDKLELVFPSGYGALSMWPEPMAGAVYTQGTERVLPLIKPLASGKMHFMEQRHERGFRYFLYPNTGEGFNEAASMRQRIGWARAMDVVVVPLTGERSWSFASSATPCYFTQQQPMPRLDHVANLASVLTNKKNTLWNEISSTKSVGEDIPSGNSIFLTDCFRNPFGVQYGGMTGGVSMNPFEGAETLWSGEKNGLLLGYMVERCYNDRQPGAIYEDNGKSFKVDDYLNPNGTQPYDLFNNVFLAHGGIVQDLPWNWKSANKSHEQFVEANNLVPPYRDLLKTWDPIDTQHMYRYSRMLKMLVFLDNDPLARRRMEAACELERATYYEGPGGRLAAYLSLQANIGAGFGREHAEAGDFCAAAFACGGPGWRSRWREWFETYHDALAHIQTPSGTWEAMTSGKAATDAPLGNGTIAFFRVQRPDEDIFTAHALRGIKESIFGDGRDPARYTSSHDMLIKAGRNYWNLLWHWRQDLTGPDCGGHFDRCAVGPIGPVTPADMFDSHADHPPEQFMAGIYCDGYRTGLSLGTWSAEEPTITPELQAALERYWGTPNILTAALNNGVSNIWNNCALIAWIQKNY
jgi:hypothetical protein